MDDVQELFLAHVRLGNVLEQQQLAMKISKAAPGELQTFWVVCSMLTQADRARFGAGAGMSQEMLLKLAGGVISKQLQREEVVSYEGVLVYLDILLAQGSFEECTELLEGPCARAVQIPHELLRLKVHCCSPVCLVGPPARETCALLGSCYPACFFFWTHACANCKACCNHASIFVQAQTALVSRQQDKAKALLMESLQSLNPDDWAGYMLLFSCFLPSTALPFDQAAEGLISVQGGFGGLEETLNDPEHWASLHPGSEAPEGSYKEACNELDEFLSATINKVRCPISEIYACFHTYMHACLQRM